MLVRGGNRQAADAGRGRGLPVPGLPAADGGATPGHDEKRFACFLERFPAKWIPVRVQRKHIERLLVKPIPLRLTGGRGLCRFHFIRRDAAVAVPVLGQINSLGLVTNSLRVILPSWFSSK